ncbi:hypothetical protein Tco_0069039 [Tanacetum coccineum]
MSSPSPASLVVPTIVTATTPQGCGWFVSQQPKGCAGFGYCTTKGCVGFVSADKGAVGFVKSAQEGCHHEGAFGGAATILGKAVRVRLGQQKSNKGVFGLTAKL